MNKLFTLAVAWVFAMGCAWVSAASLSLSSEGIVVDDAHGGKVTLQYPQLCNEAKKIIKIADKNFAGTKATIKYEGGGVMELELVGSDVDMKFSDIPADIKMIYTNMTLALTYGDGGKYACGGELKDFPKEKAPKPFLYQGAAKTLQLVSPAGGKIVIQVPNYSFQQLQDNRGWNNNSFQWQMWAPYFPDRAQVTLKVSDTVPAVATGSQGAAGTGEKKPAAAVKETVVEKPEIKLEKVSDTQVLKWKDGKKAVFFLAFDDSCASHIKNVIPELQKRHMVGTFYVIAGNGNFRDQPAWAKEAKTPAVELGNHTFTHGNVSSVEQLDEELTKAIDAINQRVPDRNPHRLISFGQPGGVKWTVTKEEIAAELAKHNLINRPPFWGAAIHVKTVEDMNKLVDAAIKKGDMGHLDFHGVGGDWLAATMDFFNATLDKLEAERPNLWLTDHISAYKYQSERKTAEVKVSQADAKQMRIVLTSKMDPTLYDQPLTLATKVPADWAKVQVTQGKNKATMTATDGVVRYDAMPGAEEIVLQPAGN